MQHMHHILKDGSSLVYSWFEAMHTRMDIMLWDKEKADLETVAENIMAEVMRIEQMGSCFLQESEVSAVNASEVGVPVRVSEELYQILFRSLEYNTCTEGYFDIAASISIGGLRLNQKIRLENDCMVTRLHEDVRINLSGLLKGYALDRARAIMTGSSVRNGLLNFGNSSVAALGNHPHGEGWPVSTPGIEYILHDECLTTSGNDSAQRRHIINPLNGTLLEGKGMVSVVTQTAEEGEVLSTVKFIKEHKTNTYEDR